MPAAVGLGEDATGLCELGRSDVEQRGSWNQSQQRQGQLQLIQQADGDDPITVEQPVAEQNHQTLLLGDKRLEGLSGKEGGRGKLLLPSLECCFGGFKDVLVAGETIPESQRQTCKQPVSPATAPV